MSKTSIKPLSWDKQHVLDVLSFIVTKRGQSLSWYTSKKHRTWITLRGFDPVPYTTSVEHDNTNPQVTYEHAFCVLMYNHWPKFMQRVPPTSTWLTSRAVQDQVTDALLWLGELTESLDLETGEIQTPEPYISNSAMEAEGGEPDSIRS